MKSITDHIPHGIDNAISQAELVARTGLESRVVRKLIENARRNKVPICSLNNGYYFPANKAEALPYLKAQQSRINTGNTVITAVEDYVSGVGGDVSV